MVWLKKQRKELDRKGALLSIYPFDHNIKNSYFKLRRNYNKNTKDYQPWKVSSIHLYKEKKYITVEIWYNN